MIFFAVATLLTLAVVVFLLRPLLRGAETSDSRLPAISVYRAQLNEIDRDLEANLLSASEADAARTEISRRLLAEERRCGADGRHRATNIRWAALIAVMGVPFLTLGIYSLVGNAGLPDMPLAARLAEAPQNQSIDLLVAKVEKHLASNPNDPRGWAVLAPVYLRLGRFNDAATAFANANRLGVPSVKTETGLGEALVGIADGVVTDDARAAFQRALVLDPNSIRASFFLAVALEQDGDQDGAAARWRRLLAETTDPNGGWRAVAQERLARLATPNSNAPAANLPASNSAGPNQAQIEAARQMAPAERQAMIESMVAGLAARLVESPDDKDGWIRLLRAYTVLGDKEAAATALTKAKDVFAENAEALAQIKQVAAELGLEP